MHKGDLMLNNLHTLAHSMACKVATTTTKKTRAHTNPDSGNNHKRRVHYINERKQQLP